MYINYDQCQKNELMHWFFIKKSKVENESVNNELKVTLYK